jgi:hypothetical protein
MPDWSRKKRIIVVLVAAPLAAGVFALISMALFVLAFLMIWLQVGDGYGVPMPFWAKYADVFCVGMPILCFVGTFTAALIWALSGSRSSSQGS